MTDDHPSTGSPKKTWLDKLSQLFQGEPKDRNDLVEVIADAEERDLIDQDTKDMIEGVYEPSTLQDLKAAEKLAAYGAMNEKDLLRELKRVEKEMLDAARNLEFETAAQLRDQLKDLKELAFGISESEDVPVAATGTDGRPATVASLAAARKRSR